MRLLLVTISLAALMACEPTIPDSGANIGTGFTGIGDEGNTSFTAVGTTGVPVAPVTPVNSSAISDENDFSAVSGRESIETDAARIAANRAQYQVVAVTDLPQRSGSSLSSVVEFALSTNNSVGQSLYSRSGGSSTSRFTRNCAKYQSADFAQEAFLSRGGPQRDAMGIDPDGDGFACYWNPAAYRQARSATPAPAPIAAESLVISSE